MKTVRTKIEFTAALQKELERLGIADISEILADFEQHFRDSAKLNMSEAEICEKLGNITDIAGQYAEETSASVFPDPTVTIAPVFTENVKTTVQSEPVKEAEMNFGPLVLDDFGDVKEIEELIKAAPVYPDTEDKSKQSEAARSDENEIQNTHVKTGTPQNNSMFNQNGFSFNNTQFSVSGLIAVVCVDIFVLSWALSAFFTIIVGFFSIPVALIGSGIGMVINGALKVFNIGTIFNTFGVGMFGGISTILLGAVLLCVGGLFVLVSIKLVKLCIKIVKSLIDWHGTMIFGKKVFKPKTQFAEN